MTTIQQFYSFKIVYIYFQNLCFLHVKLDILFLKTNNSVGNQV